MTRLPWMRAGWVLLGTLATAAVRVVSTHEKAVVLRFGRVERLRGPGLVAILPGVERVIRISVRDRTLQPRVIAATTSDDMRVRVTATARFRVVDPISSVVARANVCTYTAKAVETVIRDCVGSTELRDLARCSPEREQQLRCEVNTVVYDWGVEVRELEISTIELQLTPELLHWAQRLHDGHRPGA